jgi:hypothetical protein
MELLNDLERYTYGNDLCLDRELATQPSTFCSRIFPSSSTALFSWYSLTLFGENPSQELVTNPILVSETDMLFVAALYGTAHQQFLPMKHLF